MKFNFDKLFKITIWFLKVNRSHPDVPKDIKWGFQLIIMHGLYLIILSLLFYCIIFHDIKKRMLAEVCYKGTLAVFGVITTCAYCVMLKHQNSFQTMIETIKKDYMLAESFPKEEQIIILDYVKKGQRDSQWWMVLAIPTSILFIFKPIVLMIIRSASVGEFELIPIIYPITYPDVLEQVKNELLPYLVIFILSIWYCFYSAIMYMGFLPLAPIFLTHACGQLELVKLRIKELFPDQDYEPQANRDKLKLIITQLDHIYCFVGHIQKSFQFTFELILKATTITLPLSLYQVIETYRSTKEPSLEFAIIVFGCFIISGSPCYYSDLLIQIGESVRQAIYSSGWEKHRDNRARSTILMLMIRSTRPIAIRTMFRVLCLDAMTEVCHTGYVIFNLLNAAYN